MPSLVWNNFIKLNSTKARCTVSGCNAVIIYSSGTSGLNYRLKHQHNIDCQSEALKRPAPETSNESLKRQRKILEYCKSPSIDEDVSRMVAQDNFSFNQIAQSDFIRQSLAAKYPGQIIPKDNKGISASMTRFYETKEAELKLKLAEMKENGKKFSATLD
jgi:hypothetical protein